MRASHANMEEHVAQCTTKITISVTAEEELEKTVNKVNFTLGDISQRANINSFPNIKSDEIIRHKTFRTVYERSTKA